MTNLTTSKRALCFEDRHHVTEVLQKHGFVVERRRQKEVTTGLVGHVSRLILDRMIAFIYVDFPLHLARREESFWHRVMTWARFATENKVAFVLLGSSGKKLQIAEILKSRDEGTISLTSHRLCHFGIKLNEQSPMQSGTSFSMATNLPIKSHACCGKPADQHEKEWWESNQKQIAVL